MTQAETALAGYDARSAIAAAQAASETAEQLIRSLDRFSVIKAALIQGRDDAVRLAAEGYHMEASHTALNGARSVLNEVARALQLGSPSEIETKLQAAQVMLDEGIANGAGLVELRRSNDQRILALEQAGHAAADLIAEGRRAFDLVDEFAESTWSDIRGNGSEAQAAADRAHEHWQSARERNTMEAQEFHQAREDLDAAEQALVFVRQLVGAITQRLADLERARDMARETMAEAERSIAAGWDFVRSNDPDVGQAPEQQLREAERQMTAAQSEAAQPKPDWLRLVQAAQAADQLADTALAGARSEAETMAKLRQQTARAQELASAEVARIVRYGQVHGADLQPERLRTVATLQGQLAQAHGLAQRAEGLAEDQRRAALEQALAAFTKVQSDSAPVYAAAQSDVQRLEQLRAQLNDELAKARAALGEAEGLLQSHGALLGPGASGAGQRVRAARASFDQIRLPINGEANLNQTLRVAQAIASECRDVADDLKRAVRQQQQRSGQQVGDIVAGMLLNEVLRGGRHRGWGGSGSWSGGGGKDDGWGKMGGGGGIFGGGGGGGSFGGGGGGGGW